MSQAVISPADEAVWSALLSNTAATKYPFPTSSNRIESIVALHPHFKQYLIDAAKHTRPIIHPDLLPLISDFISLKKASGSDIEKGVYQDLTPEQFIDRLIMKRPLMFMTRSDKSILRDGFGKIGLFEEVGTPQQHHHVQLADYMSYDEMQFSAFLGVSCPTVFINNGNRGNCAKQSTASLREVEQQGIYVGLVGARFEKANLMESQHILVSKNSTKENGFGPDADETMHQTQKLRLWARFYQEKTNGGFYFPTFQDIDREYKSDPEIKKRFFKLRSNNYFNVQLYKRRMRYVAEIFLKDADDRAQEEGKKAYVHVVGLGLGVWEICHKQGEWLVDVFGEVLKSVELPHVADVDFSWFPEEVVDCCGVGNGQQVVQPDGSKITLHFSRRNPADKLVGVDAGKLLVASYAWDSNSFPGNEYWGGSLAASGDPAAACCSAIAQLQNAYINPFLRAQHLFSK
eukprot:TRINITY_DN3291_c0_g1_i1.p1 TRINITY_DN3291_c0_g1~~TRINITY_DN3291_c0_g1_i1.p1  ORF type:complete len:472 (-),score=115.20 TRINITY_DN3291_c0_g1_i1:85-1461(-)